MDADSLQQQKIVRREFDRLQGIVHRLVGLVESECQRDQRAINLDRTGVNLHGLFVGFESGFEFLTLFEEPALHEPAHRVNALLAIGVPLASGLEFLRLLRWLRDVEPEVAAAEKSMCGIARGKLFLRQLSGCRRR